MVKARCVATGSLLNRVGALFHENSTPTIIAARVPGSKPGHPYFSVC